MISLILAFHNHQPVGNFGWVVQQAWQNAYLPLMRTLDAWPTVRFAQHYTGILLDWFDTHQPAFTQSLQAAARSGRMELISGGYYEPILPMLPERDRQAQIAQLNRRIQQTFGQTPEGLWVAERVWEPALAATLHDAGIRYTFLDDTHFKCAGLTDPDLTGYFITEDDGKPLAVFPIDKKLRYTIPFAQPEETFRYLHQLNSTGHDRVVVFADDGEKFGVWPGTFQTVYGQKWLERFCALLASESGWVRTVLPGHVLATHKPVGRIYLPTASYSEMLHWALPDAKSYTRFEDFEKILKKQKLDALYGDFVRGGFWRNFLSKYAEANMMQKKMLRASNRLHRLRQAHAPQNTEPLNQAEQHLLASQCNCPYWHGVFGGLYLMNIRSAIYSEMIAAERVMDTVEQVTQVTVSALDYDLDGNDEVLIEGPVYNLYLRPECGGSIQEYDFKPKNYNLINTLQRRPEGYHNRLKAAPAPKTGTAAAKAGKAKTKGPAEAHSIHDAITARQPGLLEMLAYDHYRHGWLHDRFPGGQPTAGALRANTLQELGDFARGQYSVQSARIGTHTHILLAREGFVDGRPVYIEKRIALLDDSADLAVHYTVRSLDAAPLQCRFGVEFAFTPSAGTEPDRYYVIDGSGDDRPLLNTAGATMTQGLTVVDEWLGLRIGLRFGTPALTLRAPLETVSLSESGMESIWQGSLVMPVWELSGVTEWTTEIILRIYDL